MTRSPKWADHWSHIRDNRKTYIDRGQCLIQFVPSAKGGKIHVCCPFSLLFNERAKELSGARWLRKTRAWTFNYCARRLVLELCEQIWGRNKIVKKGSINYPEAD